MRRYRPPQKRTILDDIHIEVMRALSRGESLDDQRLTVNESGARQLLAASGRDDSWRTVAGVRAIGLLVAIDEAQAEPFRVTKRE